jgi:hypothetical protein
MIIAPGDKLAIAHRRLFAEDRLRFFIGTLEAYEEGMARLTGYSWVHEPFAGTFHRKEGARTKVLPLAAGGFITYVLPGTCAVDAVRFEARGGMLWMTDGMDFRLDMTEGQRGE